ncbi:MAG: hypothetical protein ACI9VS_002614 [Candidatus Binatia bacterium]
MAHSPGERRRSPTRLNQRRASGRWLRTGCGAVHAGREMARLRWLNADSGSPQHIARLSTLAHAVSADSTDFRFNRLNLPQAGTGGPGERARSFAESYSESKWRSRRMTGRRASHFPGVSAGSVEIGHRGRRPARYRIYPSSQPREPCGGMPSATSEPSASCNEIAKGNSPLGAPRV